MALSAAHLADKSALARMTEPAVRRRLEPLLDDEVFDRAVGVQGLLASVGQHRLPIPDLVIAACAERAGLAVLHDDADFERIAAVTGQPHHWVVARGSL